MVSCPQYLWDQKHKDISQFQKIPLLMTHAYWDTHILYPRQASQPEVLRTWQGASSVVGLEKAATKKPRALLSNVFTGAFMPAWLKKIKENCVCFLGDLLRCWGPGYFAIWYQSLLQHHAKPMLSAVSNRIWWARDHFFRISNWCKRNFIC